MTADGRRLIDVAIVGGGLAGAAMATLVARRGFSVSVLERSPRWRWHGCGVFSSPAATSELRSLGVDDAVLDAVARPIPAMRVETAKRTVFRMTYGAGEGGDGGAVGFDREALDRALLDLASSSGAEILRSHAVVAVEPSIEGRAGRLTVRGPDRSMTIAARVIVGADGIRSVVARDVGVARPARLGPRVGLTWHIADPVAGERHDARMILLEGAYCGLAPVPGGRLNVGIVLYGRDRLRDLAKLGAANTGAEILAEVLGQDGGSAGPYVPAAIDSIAGAAPLGHRVTRRAGVGWALIGDAAGFLDPFTGEGLSRALVSARLAADALSGQSDIASDLLTYDQAMRERFWTKDLVSVVVQAFLARPLLFEYAARRLAARERLRETMGMVLGDLVPARHALDPRFIAALLAP